MEKESNSMQTLCRSGCGFYGNPSTDGLCSKCYKEALKKKNQPPNPPLVASPSTNVVTAAYSNSTSFMDTSILTIPSISSISAQSKIVKSEVKNEASSTQTTSKTITASEADESLDISSNDDDKDTKTKKKYRCAICRKKVGLTGFECRCGGLYCGIHRYSDKHNCTFDYRQLGAQEIRRNNPVVIGEKIQKI